MIDTCDMIEVFFNGFEQIRGYDLLDQATDDVSTLWIHLVIFHQSKI